MNGLRANALAAIVLLLLEYGLGMGVNLFVVLPPADHGKAVPGAFAAAVDGGPPAVAAHALLGTLLLLTASAALVRALVARSRPLAGLTLAALLAMVAAWVGGASFVGDGSNAASLAMALAAGAAILCYAVVLHVAPRRAP